MGSVERDRDLLIEAADQLSLGKLYHRKAREMLEEGNASDKVQSCKLAAEGTKLRRQAQELKDRVSARDHDRDLIRHEREMSGLRGSH